MLKEVDVRDVVEEAEEAFPEEDAGLHVLVEQDAQDVVEEEVNCSQDQEEVLSEEDAQAHVPE